MARNRLVLIGAACALTSIVSATEQLNSLLTCDDPSGTICTCDDALDCTTDSKDGDGCQNTPIDSFCNDGRFCNGQEFCNPLAGPKTNPTGCEPGLPALCPVGLFCSSVLDRCVACDNDSQCSDNFFCNGFETCNERNECQPGTPPNCDDGVACTVDTCGSEGGGACVNTPTNAACGDGAYCNGVEVCDPTLGCQAGTPPNCNDGVACTVDTCNEATDSCVNTPNNAACGDGAYCNGVEVCHPTLGCQAGAPPNCNDGVACTVDTCNEATDSCVNTPNNGLCDDGLYCNGPEHCDPLLGCQDGTPPNCDDGVSCTVDSCDEAIGLCRHEDQDVDDDGVCDGDDPCPESNIADTIVIGTCDSGVANQVYDDGCAMADRIGECASSEMTQGNFDRCVMQLTRDWQSEELITDAEKRKIQGCLIGIRNIRALQLR